MDETSGGRSELILVENVGRINAVSASGLEDGIARRRGAKLGWKLLRLQLHLIHAVHAIINTIHAIHAIHAKLLLLHVVAEDRHDWC